MENVLTSDIGITSGTDMGDISQPDNFVRVTAMRTHDYTFHTFKRFPDGKEVPTFNNAADIIKHYKDHPDLTQEEKTAYLFDHYKEWDG